MSKRLANDSKFLKYPKNVQLIWQEWDWVVQSFCVCRMYQGLSTKYVWHFFHLVHF